MDSFSILTKVHLAAVLLFLISSVIKVVLIFKNNDSFDGYRAKTKMPEILVTVIFLVTGIIMIVMKDANFHQLFWIKLGVVVAGIPLGIIGTKKHSKVFVLLSCLCFVGAYGLSEVAKKKLVIVKVEVENTADFGVASYKANCVKCHGEDGKKGVDGASDLSLSMLPQNDAITVIADGRNKMPAFYSDDSSKGLTKYDLESIAEYIQTLKAK